MTTGTGERGEVPGDLGPFLRAARDAARQALFFVDLLMPVAGSRWWNGRVQNVVASYWPSATTQLRGLIPRVRLPEGSPQRLEEAWGSVLEAVEEAAATGYSSEGALELRDQLTRFLETSRKHVDDDRFRRRFRWVVPLVTLDLPNILRYLRRHLSFVVVAALVVAVAFGVEPVRGLLYNEGKETFLYLLLLPLVAYVHLCRFAWNLIRDEGAHPWDVGRLGFWRFRPLAVAPGRSITRWPAGVKLRPYIALQQTLRSGAYLAGAALAVFLLHRLANGTPVTVAIILWIFWAMLVLANQLDLWDYLLTGPVRLSILGVVVICVVCLRLGWGSTAFICLFLAGGLLLATYNLLVGQRLRSVSWVSVVALVLVAGLVFYLDRAAQRDAWRHDDPALGNVDHLGFEEWPMPGDEPVVVVVASGGGSRSAVYTALTLEALRRDLPDLARQVQLISSVSGGSLASAAYVAAESGCGTGSTEWSGAVQHDFLYPTLVGAIWPFESRATAIEEAWRDGPVGLGSCTLGALAQRWRAAPTGDVPFPVPMFSATTLDGHNVAITPLDKAQYVDVEQQERARRWASEHRWFVGAEYEDNPLTWVYHRDGIYSLQDLLGDRDVLLSSAVRASASFPFGFPVVRVETRRREDLVFSPVARAGEVQLTDGGALSNSGMWPLFQLLVNRREALRPRGVLLIFVEASKMPTYRGLQGKFNSLLGTIRDQGGIGRNLHQRMLDVLELHYEDRLVTAQLDLIPRERFNVFTTWALDDESLHRLRVSFKARWCEERDRIEEVWGRLRGMVPDGQGGDRDLIARDRPPMD